MKKIFLFALAIISIQSLQAQTDSLQQYTGKYTFPDGSPVKEITVVFESGVLSASSAMGSTELRKTDMKDVFDIVAFGGTATFKRNTEEKVTGVQIVVGDVNIEGTRSDGLAYYSQRMKNQSIAEILHFKGYSYKD